MAYWPLRLLSVPALCLLLLACAPEVTPGTPGGTVSAPSLVPSFVPSPAPGPALTGQVRTSNGLVTASVLVRLVGRPDINNMTDANGRYTLAPVPPGKDLQSESSPGACYGESNEVDVGADQVVTADIPLNCVGFILKGKTPTPIELEQCRANKWLCLDPGRIPARLPDVTK